ncbi:hypothetical protein [Litoreibacter albidus]|uniref:hypothetical protein n=1 Tax=Litoreibacter albidus TaxID=670155 RepID=UPI003736B84A
MRLSSRQMQELEDRVAAHALSDGLWQFEQDTREIDPELADQISTYRQHGDRSIYARIVALTDIGLYQRGLLALCLQSGVDMTIRPEFHYIMRNPALSGNVKARHVILMAMGFQRVLEGTT